MMEKEGRKKKEGKGDQRTHQDDGDKLLPKPQNLIFSLGQRETLTQEKRSLCTHARTRARTLSPCVFPTIAGPRDVEKVVTWKSFQREKHSQLSLSSS